MAEPLKLGLIGAGTIAQSYLKALEHDFPAARLVAVADSRAEAAEKIAAETGATAFPSAAELTLSGNCDAVLLCTPPATHAVIACGLLERGMPVLCEKPLSIDLVSARRMAESAQRGRALLMMASKFRYVEDVIRLKGILASGTLGDIILVENVFTARVDMRRRWNSRPETSGGGVLIDNGTHAVDIARYLLGPLAEVLAVEGRRVQTPAVEDTAELFLRSIDGIWARIDLSWTIDKELDWFLRVHGSEGVAQVGWKDSRYRRTGDVAWTRFGGGYDKVAAFRSKLANFCGAVRGAEPPVISVAEAVASVEAIQAAYRSILSRRWEPVADISSGPRLRAAE